jgi:hypothetical protein
MASLGWAVGIAALGASLIATGSAAPAVASVTGRVAGEVVVRSTGKAVAGARIVLPGSGMSTTSEADGSFAFSAPVPTETPYRRIAAVVTASGWGTWTIRGVPLYPNNTLQLHAEMTRHSVVDEVQSPRDQRQSGAGLSPGTPSTTGTLTGLTCTGWTSQIVPPPTIRVYLHAENVSQQYGFVFYMTHVLPSEWIGSWDADALGAGALAVKTYAWYRTLSGNARSSGSGCADIRDDTSDQVFNPGYSYPNTDAAVYATLGSVLRRSGLIFLAQYWSGSSGDPCAAVTSGTFAGRMDQWGTQTCALQGVLWPEITQTFYTSTTFTNLKNLLVNPGAEAASMYMWQKGANASITRTSGGAAAGSWSWTVKSTDGQNWWMGQQQLESGTATTRYEVKAALKCPSSYSTACLVAFRVITIGSGGGWVSKKVNESVPRDGAWHLYTFDPAASGISQITSAQIKIVSARQIGVDSVSLTSPFGGR